MSMTTEDFLEHFGVKGMKWGVRKEERLKGSAYFNKDFDHNSEVYRIITESLNRKLEDIAYVSTNDVDNGRYIHILNHTISARLFKSAKYSKQLVLGPKVPLKAPSISTAEKEVKNLYDKSPSFRKFVKDNEIYFGPNPDAKTLNQVMNTAFVDDDNLFSGSIAMRQEVKQHFRSLGYNSLLDQNDIREGLAKTPLVVFDPEETLRTISTSKIDDFIREQSKATYKETSRNGYV